MIELFVYDLGTGLLKRRELGLAGDIIHDLEDGMDFTLTAPPDMQHVWKWNGLEWEEVPPIEPPLAPLEDRQAEAWEAIKHERSERMIKPVYIQSVDKHFQADIDSVTKYNGIASMIATNTYEPINWKTEDNSFQLLTIDLFKEVQTAISNRNQRVFMAAERHKEQMLLADDPENYDYSSGWD